MCYFSPIREYTVGGSGGMVEFWRSPSLEVPLSRKFGESNSHSESACNLNGTDAPSEPIYWYASSRPSDFSFLFNRVIDIQGLKKVQNPP